MSQKTQGSKKAFSMAPSINSSFAQLVVSTSVRGFRVLLEIWETGNSDKGADVTICDLVAQLEGRDINMLITSDL